MCVFCPVVATSDRGETMGCLCFRVHQEVVEESFLPTVRTLMNAPATSPLAEVDVNNVVELLVELTRPSALIKPPPNTGVRICPEPPPTHYARWSCST